ncbi:MOB kinase activator 2-like isoform X1 [Centruroides sculpturatus]|uniref:MOB kinase activator 2-like isoform X1 n=1 Tax=Centruroides sculpturatus TaxID=218467 RepID=UPI000C6EB9F6|nr:MOB kinase activator 2-like isoform X1 [Centruroides sculpturatus]
MDIVRLLTRALEVLLCTFCYRKARRKDKDVSVPSQEEPKLYLESAVLECTVPETRLRETVELPPRLDYNEWLASHTLAFFDHINLIYGTISEFCTMSGCPDMTGPGGRQYLWFDERGKKCKVAAPQYIDYVMTFTQKTVNDECIFPTKFDKEFPSSFESIVKKIHRLLFHVIAHLYHAHFKEIVLLNLHAHLNSLFCHFVLFNEQFKLIDEKETELLQDLAVALKIYSSDEKNCKDTKDCLISDKKLNGKSHKESENLSTSERLEDIMKNEGNGNLTPSSVLLPTSQSIPSSITALHSRTNSGGHSNPSLCALDSTIFTSPTPLAASCGSSPVKFQ